MLCGNNKLVAIVQPHRYSRRRSFTEFCSCFNEADEVLAVDVYAAGEAPIDDTRPPLSLDFRITGIKRPSA